MNDDTLSKISRLNAEMEASLTRVMVANAQLAVPAQRFMLSPTTENCRAVMVPMRALSDELIAAGSALRRLVDGIEPELVEEDEP